MEVKLFEVRDRGTFIPCMAVKLMYNSPQEHFLLRRAGYSEEQICSSSSRSYVDPYVLFTNLLGGNRCEYDPYNWDNRTMKTAHQCVLETWNELKSGDVIDVEFIRGETFTPKTSEANL